MNDQRIAALAEHLSEQAENITVQRDDSHEFTVNGEDYLVLTEEEADVAVKERILEDVWAFNAEFLVQHLDIRGYEEDDTLKSLKAVQEKCCESCNGLLRAALKDQDAFVKASVDTDGRGHFLNGYDGSEEEVKVGDVWFHIYRTN